MGSSAACVLLVLLSWQGVCLGQSADGNETTTTTTTTTQMLAGAGVSQMDASLTPTLQPTVSPTSTPAPTTQPTVSPTSTPAPTTTSTTTTVLPTTSTTTGLPTTSTTTTVLPTTSTTTTVPPTTSTTTTVLPTTSTTKVLPTTNTTTTVLPTTSTPTVLPTTRTTTVLPTTSTPTTVLPTSTTTTVLPTSTTTTVLPTTSTTTVLPTTSTTTSTTIPTLLPTTNTTTITALPTTSTTTVLPTTSTTIVLPTTSTTTVLPTTSNTTVVPTTSTTTVLPATSTTTTTVLPTTSTTTVLSSTSTAVLPTTSTTTVLLPSTTSSTTSSTTTTAQVPWSSSESSSTTTSTVVSSSLPTSTVPSSTSGLIGLLTASTTTALPQTTISKSTSPGVRDANTTEPLSTPQLPAVLPVGDATSTTVTSTLPLVTSTTSTVVSTTATVSASPRMITPLLHNTTYQRSTEATSTTIGTRTEFPPRTPTRKAGTTTSRPAAGTSSTKLLTDSTLLFKTTTSTHAPTTERRRTSQSVPTRGPPSTTVTIGTTTPSIGPGKVSSPTERAMVTAPTNATAVTETEMTSPSQVVVVGQPKTPSTQHHVTTTARVTTSGRQPSAKTTARMTRVPTTPARPSSTMRFTPPVTNATTTYRMTTTMKSRVSRRPDVAVGVTTSGRPSGKGRSTPSTTTTLTTQVGENVSYMLLMSGDCSVLKENPQARQDFESQLQTNIKNALDIDSNQIAVNDVVCGSVNVSLTFTNVSRSSVQRALRDFTDDQSSQVLVYSNGKAHPYAPLALVELPEVITRPVAVPTVSATLAEVTMTTKPVTPTPLEPLVPGTDTSTLVPGDEPSAAKQPKGKLSHTELIILICVSVIGGIMLIIIIFLIVQECRRRSHTKSFDLRGTPRANANNEDFTLTKLDRRPVSYNEYGIVMNHTQNGHVRMPPRMMDTVVEENEKPLDRHSGGPVTNGHFKGAKAHLEEDDQVEPVPTDNANVQLMTTFKTPSHQGIDNPSFASEDMLDSGTETDRDNLSSELSHDIPSPDVVPAPVEEEEPERVIAIEQPQDAREALLEHPHSGDPSDHDYEEVCIPADEEPAGQGDPMLPVSAEVEYPNNELATLERPRLLNPVDVRANNPTYEMIEKRLSMDPSVELDSHEGATAF